MKAENGHNQGIREIGRAPSLMSQKRVADHWLEEIDVWFMKLHQWPISEILDKMIEMLKFQIKQKIARHVI